MTTRSDRSQLTRHPERGHDDRAALDAILDSAPFGTLSTVVDGLPWVVPMLFCRDGDRLLFHGSTGAGALRQVAAGAPAALSVMHVDAIVLAASTFHSSANYRSAVVHGALTPLEGEAKYAALNLLSEAVAPGRTGEVRAMTPKELAATLAMSMPITPGQWTAKARTGPPSGGEDPDVWQGIVPVRLVTGPPEPAPGLAASIPLPPSVQALAEHGWARGR